MKVTIVGAGWLGVPLAQHLVENGVDVSLVYRSQKPQCSDKIAIVSLQDEQSLSSTLQNADVVVFCFPSPKDGTSHAQHCLEYAKRTASGCKFIFTSTTGVYPDLDAQLNENSPLIEGNKHVETERILRVSLKDQLVIVRLAGLVAEDRLPVKMMSGSGKVYNGNEYCNLIHKQDAVGLISFLILNNVEVPIVNACAPVHPKKEDYYTQMADAVGVVVPKFEKGPTGKLILSDLSISLGYKYQIPNPFDFFQ